MKLLLVKLRTALALGPLNLLRVAWYRLGLRYGWSRAPATLAEPASG